MNRDIDANRERAQRDGLCYEAGGSGGVSGSDTPPPGPAHSSSTNNQVAGVDEADFVKNEDGILYILNAGKLRILAAWPADQTHVLSETPIEGTVQKMFVHQGKALVYSSLPATGSGGEPGPWDRPRRACTYGYDCEFTGDGRPTKLTELDLGDLRAPRVTREVRLSGSLIGARRIGTAVHTVVSDPGPVVDALSTWPSAVTCGASQAEIFYAFEALRQQNRKQIEQMTLDDWRPHAIDQRGSDLADRGGGYYGGALTDGAAITSILSLDLADATSSGFTSVISRPGAIYASIGSLYMAVPHQRGADVWYDGMGDLEQASSIHRFGLSEKPIGTTYHGSVAVKGRVLNQFAMDEYDGALRVATTTGRAPDPGTHSSLTTLAVSDQGFARLGMVDHIAPSEDIRAVRFAGNRGFVVTFKKTDPLFVFDLDPHQAPRVLSELKIPGFSTYIHMLDATHLLTIGYDADDQGSFAWFDGVLVQIFDVTDPTAPTLAQRYKIGTRGSSSEALTNHLAFTYFEPRQSLALPMTICEGGGNGQYGSMTFSGLLVFHAAADGISELGRVTHPPGAAIGCFNWWTDAQSQVRRSVFMDDYVYSISGSSVKVNALGNLGADLVQVPIQ